MERVLDLSRGFCSSASTSLPTDDPSTHHLARCQPGPLGSHRISYPTPLPDRTATHV